MNKDQGLQPSGPSRRAALAGGLAAAAVTGLPPVSVQAQDDRASDTPIGGWRSDVDGLPAYQFRATLPVVTKDPDGLDFPLGADPFFLLGNYRLTLFTHASGLYQIMTGERGWGRVNTGDHAYGDNSAQIVIGGGEPIELLGLQAVAADPNRCKRMFGTGYAQYEFALPGQIHCKRTLSVAPSADINQGMPAFVVSILLENRSGKRQSIRYTEGVRASYSCTVDVVKANSQEDPRAARARRAVNYDNSIVTDPGRSFVQANITPEPRDPSQFSDAKAASRYNARPPSLILWASPQGQASPPRFRSEATAPGSDHLYAEMAFDLPARAKRELTFVIGLAPDRSPEDLIAFARSLAPNGGQPYFRDAWRGALPDLSNEHDPIFKREMVWNAYVLEAMATYSEYYDTTFIPQGTTYDYEMDMVAACRDHLQHAFCVSYTHPKLARAALKFAMSKMTAQGELKYSDYGFGMTTNMAWNPSDQQLYLFLAISEYLRITKDYGFLEEVTPYLPTPAGYQGSTLEKLDRGFAYLRDEVGRGPHGLVRLMNSDWSDMMYADTSVLSYFWTAESHMNSAMVLSVVPSLVEQLQAADKAGAIADRTRVRDLVSGLNLYEASIRKSFYDDLGDRTFSRRIYFSPGKPFGDDNLHIEPQSFLLQDAKFPLARKKTLWSEVQSRILDDEGLGPRQREKPVVGGNYLQGTGENGAFWYALTGPLAIGVASFDRGAAADLVRRMSFSNYAKHFPNYWTGQWTASDNISSKPSGKYVGLPRPTDNYLWTAFAAYCAHAHAWPLYTYYRLKEFAI